MQDSVQHSVITLPKVFKACLEASLKSDQRIPARRRGAPWAGFDLAGQQELGHGGHESPREQVGRQHGKHDGLGERQKEVPCHA